MNVKVTADSTCDLSPALLARYDITLAPLTVIKDAGDLRRSVRGFFGHGLAVRL